jgi:uncharacterized protein YbjT (DUF2867 family)
MILVTGATGKVGRHVVAGLLEAGVAVRALVRQPLLSGLPPEVELVVGDITDPEAVREAAKGVDAAFLLWPSFSAEGAAPIVEALTEQVRRVVYLSALNVKDDVVDSVWGEVEQLLAGADWTFLRAGGFAANTLTWAAGIRAGSTVSMASPKAGRSLIHERDLADIAVLALLDDAHIGRKYELTGPQVLTQEDQVAIIGSAIGKDLRIVEQSPEEARQAMLAMGADEILAESSVRYWASLADNPEPVTPDYKTLTGKPGRTFREWAEEHADAFRVLSTEEVATQYVEAFRTGDFQRPQPGAPDVVRVAPLEYDGELVGQTEIIDNATRSLTGHEIASVEVSDPLLSANQFAVRFTFHWTGDQPPTTKLSLYTVETGHITREEVFYFTPPA